MQKPNDTVEHALRELRGITLSDKARVRLRAELLTYADFHAPKVQVAAPRASFTWLSIHAWSRAGAGLLAVLLLVGGTAYASDEALPGTPLYTVKVKIKEPLEVALATTPKKKAEKHVELAEKRLEEAAALAVNESLDEKTQVFLEQKFGEHVDRSLAAADALAATGAERDSLEVRSHLESSLVAHADILDLVEDKLEERPAETARASAQNLVRAIKLRREIVRDTRVALERDLEDKVTPSETLAIVTKAAGAVPAEPGAATLSVIAEHVEETDEALSEAKESLRHSGSDDLRRAFRKALEAERSSGVVTTLLKNREILRAVDKPVATTTATTTEPAAVPEVAH